MALLHCDWVTQISKSFFVVWILGPEYEVLTHLMDNGPGVFLGDWGGEAAEYLVQREAALPVQVTSSPGGRGRGRGPASVSLHTAHDDSLGSLAHVTVTGMSPQSF